MGLLAEKKEHVGKRARTVYSITERGREALREWLATPVSPFAMDFEALIRLFVAPLGTKDEIVATLQLVLDDAPGIDRDDAGPSPHAASTAPTRVTTMVMAGLGRCRTGQ